MRESTVERYLTRRVREIGGEVRKVSWVGRRGAPDRLVMLPRHCLRTGPFSSCYTIWVELKAPGEKPRVSQEREHKRMRAMSQTVVVIDSIEGVDGLLR